MHQTACKLMMKELWVIYAYVDIYAGRNTIVGEGWRHGWNIPGTPQPRASLAIHNHNLAQVKQVITSVECERVMNDYTPVK